MRKGPRWLGKLWTELSTEASQHDAYGQCRSLAYSESVGSNPTPTTHRQGCEIQVMTIDPNQEMLTHDLPRRDAVP